MSVSLENEGRTPIDKKHGKWLLALLVAAVLIVGFVIGGAVVWSIKSPEDDKSQDTVYLMRTDMPWQWSMDSDSVINRTDSSQLCYDSVCADYFQVVNHVANFTFNAVFHQDAVKRELNVSELADWRSLAVGNACFMASDAVDDSAYIAGAVLWYSYDDSANADVNYWYTYASTIKQECRTILN